MELAKYSVNSAQENLIKSVLVGGLYPRVARIAMPKALFERVQQGAVQKDVSPYSGGNADLSTSRKKSNSLITPVEYSSTQPLFYLVNRISNQAT